MRDIDRFISEQRPDFASSIPPFPRLDDGMGSMNPQRRYESIRKFNDECARWREHVIIALEKLLISNTMKQ